jgi:hypothetical protein
VVHSTIHWPAGGHAGGGSSAGGSSSHCGMGPHANVPQSVLAVTGESS